MAGPEDDTTNNHPEEAAGTTSPTLTPDTGDADTSAAQPETAQQSVDAIAEEPETGNASTGGEGADDADQNLEAVPSIDPSIIKVRETADVYAQTFPLDGIKTVDDLADHIADKFAPDLYRFVGDHPNMRHMVTVAVHAGGALVHATDVEADAQLARDGIAAVNRAEQYLRTRFPSEGVPPGETSIDVLMRLLDRAVPVPAAAAGLAAANAGRR